MIFYIIMKKIKLCFLDGISLSAKNEMLIFYFSDFIVLSHTETNNFHLKVNNIYFSCELTRAFTHQVCELTRAFTHLISCFHTPPIRAFTHQIILKPLLLNVLNFLNTRARLTLLTLIQY